MEVMVAVQSGTKGIYIWVPATLIDIDEYQSDHRIRTSDGILCVRMHPSSRLVF